VPEAIPAAPVAPASPDAPAAPVVVPAAPAVVPAVPALVPSEPALAELPAEPLLPAAPALVAGVFDGDPPPHPAAQMIKQPIDHDPNAPQRSMRRQYVAAP
jgi:hypothetical protein